MSTATTVRERPIIMRAASVRAILAGRKTQTRRVVAVPWANGRRCPPYEPYWAVEDGKLLFDDGQWSEARNRYGQPGDRLWVRETWAPDDSLGVIYRADYDGGEWTNADGAPAPSGWRSPIHMPRRASRLTLEITDVRVERLQDISREDAIAEGIERIGGEASCTPWRNYLLEDGEPFAKNCASPIMSFCTAWQSINGKRAPWGSNPWVWAVTFRRVEGAA